ncbi:hypothetical protein ACFLV0_01195 [Chloroflexota bacterium]
MPADNIICEVLSPVGEPPGEQTATLSPRIPDLNGKTICQVWTWQFQADIMFSALSELLKNRFPDIKIIPYTDMPTASIYRDQDKKLADLREEYLQKGCDAVIVGVGG